MSVKTRRATAAATLATWAAVTAPAAAAPALTLDGRCYLEGQQVSATGTAFAPLTPYTITLDGASLDPSGAPSGGTTSDAGGFEGTFAAPELPAGTGERVATLAASDGTSNASVQFRISTFLADFTPGQGNPRTLRVNFEAFGFGPGETVFLHYVSPRGKRRTDLRLGRTQGVCGHLRTRKRKLFPFEAERGVWRLQFDTRRRYRRGTRQASFAFYAIKVRIRRAG